MPRFLLAFLALVISATAHDAALQMTKEAEAFLASLTPQQQKQTVFAFASEEREDWHFVPRQRQGLPLKEMTSEQRGKAMALLAASLSHRGNTKALNVLALEQVLEEMQGSWRDPGRYHFTVFGTPGSKEGWGWRVEGHHLALNFTAVGENVIRTTPAFFGANPAEVRSGGRKGLRVLAEEEDLARALVSSLNNEQRVKAVIMERAPAEIFNVPGRNATKAEGISWNDLTADQQANLRALISEYLQRCPPAVAEERWKRLESTKDTLHFAWAGSLKKGDGHYYRVQSGGFVLEYDNTQNGANHVHSLWRDFDEDFGADLLGQHYRTEHP